MTPTGAPFLLHQQFAEQVRRTPDATALWCGGNAATFADLSARAGAVAAGLRANGIGAGTFVGLHIERSIDYVAALLGILETNSAVVPLPPSYPEERLREILDFAELNAVVDIAESPLRAEVANRVIHFADLAKAPGPLVEQSPGTGDQPAFVLCSSGSTGKPKMIVRSHRSFGHRLSWTWENQPFEVGEVCCQKSPMTTTHAIYELFEPLLRGTPVVLITDQEVRDLEGFWDTVKSRGVSRLLLVPSMLQASLEMPGFEAPRLRSVVLMGEAVGPKLAGRTLAAFPEPTQVYSIYGSTEASSTLVTDLRRDVRPGEDVPLGKPISAEVRVEVLKEDLTAAGPGELGMLYLGGTPLFTEYFRDPVRTAAALTLARESGERLFATQDRVRLGADGNLYFVGRVDNTVKIRGFRVDLEEVERAILLDPEVRQCAAILRDTDPLDPTLVAFVAPATVTPARVYQVSRDRLPAYMIPSVVVGLESFPLLPNGKVDRRALRDRVPAAAPAAVAAGGRGTDSERRLAAIWGEVLKLGSVPFDRSFFELGGTSLSVFTLVHRLRAAFQLGRSQMSDQAIYQFPTIAALSAYLDGLRAGRASAVAPSNSILVTLRQGTDSTLPPLFLISSAGGTLGAYQKLVKALDTKREIIGVRDPFLWGDRDPTLGFSHWVSRFVEAITERQPKGPFYLMAYSSAGSFGFEIAQRLRDQRHEVELLALIDPLAMDRATKRRFGHWALEARFMRPPLRALVRLAGRLRTLLPDKSRSRDRSRPDPTASSAEAFDRFATAARRNRGQLISLSVLLELNTELPFALDDGDFAGVDPDRYLEVLVARIQQVSPEIEADTMRNLVVQYEMQVRSQHAYQLERYDGKVLLFDPDGPHRGLLAAQLEPYVERLQVKVVPMGPTSERARLLGERFPVRIRSHYLSMRNDAFVAGVAQGLKGLI